MTSSCRAVVIASLCAAAACGGSGSSPGPSVPPTTDGDVVRVTGTERLGWDQSAESVSDVGALSFVVFVDGVQGNLAGASCATTASGTAGFLCSAPLPPLTTGQHTLQLAAERTTDGVVRLSERSAPLIVLKVAALALTQSAAPDDGATTGSLAATPRAKGVARTTIITDDLLAPSAIVPTPDGRLFVAERDRIALVERNVLRADPALLLTATPASGDAGLLDLTADPHFASNHLLWSSQVVETNQGRVVRLCRYRDAGGVLGESAIVAEFPVGGMAGRTRVRVGPDDRLYVAVGDLSRGASRDLTYEGAILRLERDGSTPRDNPSASPVLSAGHGDMRALAWSLEDAALWYLEHGPGTSAIRTLPLVALPAASTATRAEPRGFVASSIPDLDAFEFLSGAAAVGAVATSSTAGALYQLTWEDGRLLTPRSLLAQRVGGIREVAVAPDGVIYVATADARPSDATTRNLLIRVTLR